MKDRTNKDLAAVGDLELGHYLAAKVSSVHNLWKFIAQSNLTRMFEIRLLSLNLFCCFIDFRSYRLEVGSSLRKGSKICWTEEVT